MPKFQCLPAAVSIVVPPGITILEACRRAGIPIAASCGGKGICGKCRVRILAGEAPSPPAARMLSDEEINAGWRLACLTQIHGDLTVMLDERQAGKSVILVDFQGRGIAPDRYLQAKSLTLPEPSLADQRSDGERLEQALNGCGPLSASQGLWQDLPSHLRRHRFALTAVMDGHELLDILPPTPLQPLGLAVDIGTTTIAGVLCRLDDGDILAVAARHNPQAVYGDDVISRIEYSRRGIAERQDLQRLVVRAVAEILQETCATARQRQQDVYAIQVAANPTMQHLFFSWDPAAIAETPFILTARRGAEVRAEEIGLPAGRNAKVRSVPHISAYVGGDIVAGLLAHDVHDDQRNILFLDVGTNGEIVLRSAGATYACATAAGPAFEGARISCGMRATSGAINAIAHDEADVRIATVDAAPAQGICGTGLLDAVAVLLDLGLLDESGRLCQAEECPSHLPPGVARRLITNSQGDNAFLLAPAAAGRPAVLLTQRDLREFQLAKGAIAAGCRILLQHAGIRPEDIDAVLLAGAFGNYLRPASALRTGLLPAEVPLARIAAVGNAALAGSRLCLLSSAARREAERIAAEVKYCELSGCPEFETAFAEAMFMPANG